MSTSYLWAWVVVALATPLGLYALHRATRGLPLPALRAGLLWLLAVWLLVPAPVPDHAGHYAPALLVFVFEAVFQRPGQPETSALILAAASALALAAMLVVSVRRRRAAA
jgi:hypothetical protein